MVKIPKVVRKSIKGEKLALKHKEKMSPRFKGTAKIQEKSMKEYARGLSKEGQKKMMSYHGRMSGPKKKSK